MSEAPRPNTVTLTIDGAEVTVPPGTLVVEAARQMGVEVPVFCYHPKLSLAGACRMCQVEIAMAPPPGQPARPPAVMTACTMRVAPGMVVNTMAPKAIDAREAVIEFLLINHPLDCPVCDAGGECPLQDNSHAWGPKESRFEEDKRLARKGASLSPLVVLDQERCIVCYRCTRFMAEIPGQAELDFHQRGYRSQLRVIEDRSMQSRFHGNIIDLCPCGALTSDTYRFKSRPHDLDHADSVCAQCPVGCNIITDTRSNVVARVRPRQNEAVNEIWLCDKGRFGHHYASSADRLTSSLVKRDDGRQHPASWAEAIGSAAVALQRVKEQHGAQSIGVIGGRNLTNEDCYALARFASEVLETPNVDHRVGARSRAANPLARFGLDAFNSQYADAEGADAIVVIGSDVYEEMPVFWLRLRKAVTKGAKLIVANPRSTEADRIAFRRLRYRPGDEASVIRALRAGDAGATGLAPDAVTAVTDALKGAKKPLIYAGARLASRADADEIAAALVELAEGLGHRDAANYFAEGANARGAALAGLVPGESGLAAGEVIAAAAEGRIKALYLVGENVLETHPDREQAQRALQTAEVVIVHELFPTVTAEHADVVFAATSVPEKDGTLTNAEGRIQRLFQAVRPATNTRPDWRILTELSAEMGASLGYTAASEVTRELLADLPVYASLNGAIPAEGAICRESAEGADASQSLPVPSGDAAPPSTPSGRSPGAGGGLTLITYSELLGHETTVAQTPELLQMVPVPYVELNTADAGRLSIQDGQTVRLTTSKGSIERVARLNRRCPEGTCFSPDNVGSPRLNLILDWNDPLARVTLTPATVAEAAAR
ncbi:MAG TPA: NADH-quinone oxidoreductase subunit NuoG [Chloroflexota bacterium]|nr:NADH-quinone oxidoreductase subunit NuoG [Chloroflexota bacterium]